jgi:hypothetical protein
MIVCAPVALLGCEKFFTSHDRPAPNSIARSLAPAIPAESLIVEYILLERPLGDAFLNRDLWTATQPAGAPEMRALLAENGIQAGLLSGTLPSQLQTLIDTKADVVDAQLFTFPHRKEEVIPTAGPIEDCKFDLLADLSGKPEAVAFSQARCGVLVRPQVVGDGRVKVWCEPRIQHGNRVERYRPSEDGTRFTKFEEVPTEQYPTLGFEVSLKPTECLVLGSSAEQEESLGAVLFEAEASGQPRQRILVIRARQVNVSGTADLPVITPPGRRPAPVQAPAER